MNELENVNWDRPESLKITCVTPSDNPEKNICEQIIKAAKMLVEKYEDFYSCEFEDIDDQMMMLKESLKVGGYLKEEMPDINREKCSWWKSEVA